MKAKKEKKAVKRCSICNAPLLSPIQTEHGICPHCLAEISAGKDVAVTPKKRNKRAKKETVAVSPQIESAFAGPNTERLCTRIPNLALKAFNDRLKELNLTPSEYIRDLIKGDMSS